MVRRFLQVHANLPGYGNHCNITVCQGLGQMRSALNAQMLDSETLEMRVYGFVGDDYGFGSRMSAQSFADTLAANPGAKSIRLVVNSPGGSADEGIAIKNMLVRRGLPVECMVDGVAASAASLMLMGPKPQFSIRMAADARMMIHEASTITAGGVTEHQKSINGLSALNDGAADVYAARSGKDVSDVKQMMASETWMTASQAKEHGFADDVIAATGELMMRVDFAKLGYHNVPIEMVARMEAPPTATPPGEKPGDKPKDTEPDEDPDEVTDQQLETFVSSVATSCGLDRGSAVTALNSYLNDIVTAMTRNLQRDSTQASARNQGINPGSIRTMSDKDPATTAAESAGEPGTAATPPAMTPSAGQSSTSEDDRMTRIEATQMRSRLEKLEMQDKERAEREADAVKKRIEDHVEKLIELGQVGKEAQMRDDAVYVFSHDWARGERIYGTVTPLMNGQAGKDPAAHGREIDPEKASRKDLDPVELSMLDSLMQASMSESKAIAHIVKNRPALMKQRSQMGLV